MKEYDFFAVRTGDGYSVGDRYRLEANTFAEACYLAQVNELEEASVEEREPAMYNSFREILPI